MTSINADWIAARVAEAAAAPSVDPHQAVIRLRELLERCAGNFADLRPEKIPSAVVPPRRGLHPDEASAFLGAVDQGLAVVDEAGFVTLTCVHPKTPAGCYALFSRGRAGPSVNLEYLIQIGAAAELATIYGWPADRLDFERGEFDILGLDQHDRVALTVEAKARVSGQDSLERLLRAWLDYNRAGGHAPATNAGRKYTELRRLCQNGPVNVWLVATGARWSLRATWKASGITFMTAQPPMYRDADKAAAHGRRVLWSRPYDPSLHNTATHGEAGRCSWSCDEPPVWSTRVQEFAGSQSTFALCEAHHRRVQDVYGG